MYSGRASRTVWPVRRQTACSAAFVRHRAGKGAGGTGSYSTATSCGVARWLIPLLSSDSCILPPSSIDHINRAIDTQRPLIDSNITCEPHGSRPVRSEDNKAGPCNPRVSARQCCPHAAHDVIVHSLKLQRDKVRQYQKKVSATPLLCAQWGG